LITITTRASLRRYHTFTLTLGLGEDGTEWDFQRIGTASDVLSVERELQELRERLSHVEEWKRRRGEIEQELSRVWVEGGPTLAPPPYEEGEQTESASLTESASGEET
jgi:ATP-binding cassette, subfamily D (ALD), peroxisomal long-chain fatty acid import protein